MGGNYPPGTSAGDPRAPWNAPDHSHEHRWRTVEDSPIIEDGAAIFREECEYVEGRYGEGWECEESRHYRFEYSQIESPKGEKTELHDITEWDENDSQVQANVVAVEEAYHNMPDETTIDVDPDPDGGVVIIEYNEWKLRFEA